MCIDDKIFRIQYEVKRKIRNCMLHNKEIAIISNNCIGGKLAHDFGLRLNSPIVNMQIVPEDYIRFLKNMEYYLSIEVDEVKEINEECLEKYKKVGGSKIEFPVGRIDDIYLYFAHETDFESAVEKWNRRKSRMKGKKKFYILAAKKVIYEKEIQEFAKLELKNKLLLVIDEPVKIENCECICLNVPKGIHFMDRIQGSYRYYYECFPFLKWLNQEQ